ncbi:hypothetical protein [Marinobacterium weihaiense]|uniref:Transmembrane protein n=1 Tax=Marinobacterium weihaiense TaxID=2851016 RepID=A0ABS6MEW4_9GAMM|nr:hypothetical protein [Marinobacterium weihaiense]MBV0934858.1 hypothetical protein [Marinobacterium weihaiense]
MKLRTALALPSIRRVLFFSVLLALAGGWVAGRMTHPALGLEVGFYNASEVMIESIQLDFGSADTQSRIQVFRIAPGETRTLALNHSKGMGFNVQVNYSDGRKQEFCALRGDDRARPELELRP